MLDKIIELSILSGGLLPMMGVLLLITIAVIVERIYFFHHVLRAGDLMEHDLQRVGYRELEKIEALSKHYKNALQRSVIAAAVASNADDPETADRHIDEALMWQLPKVDRYIWILDTSVTLAPLMGLLGTIIGMVHAFDILGITGGGGSATQMVSGGIAEALVATGAGLFIAILAVLFLNHFNKRSRSVVQQMDLLKVMMINRLYGGGSSSQGKGIND